MLSALRIILFLTVIHVCKAGPTFQEEYRGDYVPKTIETFYGSQVVAPDTPYVAAAGPNQLYFIDTRHDEETAKHIKEQIERAMVPKADEKFSIDEISATAKIVNAVTNETTFVFDPPYARVIFAAGINRQNPSIKLPEHEAPGDWLVTYNTNVTSTLKKRVNCSIISCWSAQSCMADSGGWCDLCHDYRVDSFCDYRGVVNAIGICHPKICMRAIDTPRETGETDASYYQRMDKLHWG